MPDVSIVMTARQRPLLLARTLASIAKQGRGDVEVIVVEDGADGGDETRRVCETAGARYFQRVNRPDVPYSNPAVPINIGLRRATGDMVILQNAECLHASDNTIARMVEPVRINRRFVTFPCVSARHPDGRHWHWYIHPKLDCGMRPFFFCGAIAREHIERLRGMDEDYRFYGWEDNDFADRMERIGLVYEFLPDVTVHHQWHPGTNCYGMVSNVETYQRKSDAMKHGIIGPERNLDREWGALES